MFQHLSKGLVGTLTAVDLRQPLERIGTNVADSGHFRTRMQMPLERRTEPPTHDSDSYGGARGNGLSHEFGCRGHDGGAAKPVQDGSAS
jgi:hypothetical protein